MPANTVKFGYLLPTRERIMAGEHETRSILTLAQEAEAMGFESLWIGDSVTAKPRHDALSMLAADRCRDGAGGDRHGCPAAHAAQPRPPGATGRDGGPDQ